VFNGKNTRFKTTTLTRHADSTDHNDAVYPESVQGKLLKAVEKVLSEKEATAIVALNSTFWIVQEHIAISKQHNLLELLPELNCPQVSDLNTGKKITYTSDKADVDMLSALDYLAGENVDQSLLKSPFISFLCDERTYIGVIYSRVIYTYTYTPSTLFLTNLKFESATGEFLFRAEGIDLGKSIFPAKVMS